MSIQLDINKLKENKYEGVKTIFMVFTCPRFCYNRNAFNILKKESKLTFVTYGWYEIGDAGFESALYVGDLTHSELVELYSKYQDGREYDNKIFMDTYFEYKGWHFAEEDIYDEDNSDYDEYDDALYDIPYVIEESGEKIKEYLEEKMEVDEND